MNKIDDEHEYWQSPKPLRLNPEELDDDIPVMPSFDQISSLAQVAQEGLRFADVELSEQDKEAERQVFCAHLATVRRLL